MSVSASVVVQIVESIASTRLKKVSRHAQKGGDFWEASNGILSLHNSVSNALMAKPYLLAGDAAQCVAQAIIGEAKLYGGFAINAQLRTDVGIALNPLPLADGQSARAR
jgi:hypothetical protein